MAEQKSALITGASSGIGKETAVALAQRGWKVYAAARRLDLLQELQSQFPDIIPMQVDLADDEDLERFCDQVAKLKALDALINNAGYAVRGMVEQVPLDDMKRMFQVNVFALMRVTQAALPAMRAAGDGVVINMSSLTGKMSLMPGNGAYGSSKYAVEGITDSLRYELLPFGIRVVSIRPGPIDTDFQEVAAKISGERLKDAGDYNMVLEAMGRIFQKLFMDSAVPGPELVTAAVLHALEDDDPMPNYYVGPIAVEYAVKYQELGEQGFAEFMRSNLGF